MSKLSLLLGVLGLYSEHRSILSILPFDRERLYIKPESHQTSHGRWRGRKPACQCCHVTLGRDYYCRNRMCEGYMLREPRPRDYWPGRAKTEGEYYHDHELRRPKMRPTKAHAPTYCRWCGHRVSYQTYSMGECTQCQRTQPGYARAMTVAGGAR